MKKFRWILLGSVILLSNAISAESFCNDSTNHEKEIAQRIILCESELEKHTSYSIDTIGQWVYLAMLYRKAGDTGKSTTQLKTLLAKANELGAGALFEVHFAQGVNAFYARNFLESLENFKLALADAIAVENLKGIANAYNGLANVAQVFADYDSMSQLLEESLKIYKEIDDSSGVAKVLNNLANAYRYNGENNKALVMYRQAMRYHQQQQSTLKVAHTQMNMSRSMVELKQFDKAMNLLELSISLFTKFGATHRIIEANAIIAQLYLDSGNLSRAKLYLTKNDNLKVQIDSNHFDPGSELVMAKYYLASDQPLLAETLLLRGIDESRKQVNIEQLKHYLMTLTKWLEADKQSVRASQYWQEYADVVEQQMERKQNYFGKLHFLSRPELNRILNKDKATEESTGFSMLTIFSLIGLVVFSFLVFYRLNQTGLVKPEGSHQPGAGKTNDKTNNSVEQPEFSSHPREAENNQTDNRQLLVDLMISSVQLWEQESHQGLIELAEKSKIWKVTNDDGRLRVRAMERYLSIDLLPKNPRWRNVIRTCHFVLANSNEESDPHRALSKNLATYLEGVKRTAMG